MWMIFPRVGYSYRATDSQDARQGVKQDADVKRNNSLHGYVSIGRHYDLGNFCVILQVQGIDAATSAEEVCDFLQDSLVNFAQHIVFAFDRRQWRLAQQHIASCGETETQRPSGVQSFLRRFKNIWRRSNG